MSVEEKVKDIISQVRSWKSEQGIALNAEISSTSTYLSARDYQKIKNSEAIIKSTLKYPLNHQFIVGKPNIQEKITSVVPKYSKIGPVFKNDSKKIVKWIKENQDKIIKAIEKNDDIIISDIPELKSDIKEGLMKDGFIDFKKEMVVKGKEKSSILSFNGFYLEICGE